MAANTVAFFNVRELRQDCFPTPFLHMNLHYILGGTASPPYIRLTSKIRQEECQEASKLLPMATSNLVKSLMPCSYPGHGGFLCAGVMGQNPNTFRAR